MSFRAARNLWKLAMKYPKKLIKRTQKNTVDLIAQDIFKRVRNMIT